MNKAQFKKLLESVSNEQWQSVVDGEALLLVDDEVIQLGPVKANEAIILADRDNAQTADQLRRACLQDVDDILINFYLTRPLTRTGFNNQVKGLVERYGAEKFGAPEGQLPELTLFVDVAEVIAEDTSSPRHRYGAGCELSTFSPLSPEEQVIRWIESGGAYDRYLGMNVCRYNC